MALGFLGLVVVGGPLLLTVVLGVSSLLTGRSTRRRSTRLVQAAIVSGLLGGGRRAGVDADPGHAACCRSTWATGSRSHIHYHFSIKFVFDRLSVPFAILSFVLSGTIGAFASRYMHRERGFNRFFVLYAIFVLGMVVTSLAGTIETLFAGWELVGLSSALLGGFYQERPAPSRNALWVWCVYRVSDAALLAGGRRDAPPCAARETSTRSWARRRGPRQQSHVTSSQALVVGLLLLIAAAGKSALVPFSGWLPRAMEGPTPSSAVFYGALSVHLGAFLLLRTSPLLERVASVWSRS